MQLYCTSIEAVKVIKRFNALTFQSLNGHNLRHVMDRFYKMSLVDNPKFTWSMCIKSKTYYMILLARCYVVAM